ncbi:translation initiation factor IF-2 subunit gamma, partial [Candidatus Bathyarchaeota archaeon]|nr:translation initiation factor IF-2 subunit gamma [Candidatus Bathyarchaeota archaeon]
MSVERNIPSQPEVNIGTLGHVDNGKSTLVQALTGIWTGKYSEEIIRGITIRIGYADAAFYRCTICGTFGTSDMCSQCGLPSEFLRTVSFVDCPGLHSLMLTMLSGAALMDGALLVLSAPDKCPQPQDREHLAAAQMVGVKNLIVVQNKIDLVSKERVLESYHEIQDFVRCTIAEKAPIVPISAQRGINIDSLIRIIQERILTPQRDLAKPPIMSILRSFDINRPGTLAMDVQGGVLGGSIIQGRFKVGEELEIRPGTRVEKGGKSHYSPIQTRLTSLRAGNQSVNEAVSGGLIGMGTLLDPSLTRADSLVGNIVGLPDHMPPVASNLTLSVDLYERAMGTEEQIPVDKIRTNEALVLNTGTSVSAGIVTSARDSVIDIELRRPVCIELS